jgi:hypothetical protein
MHCVTEKFTIGQLLIEKNVINDSPPYQRASAVWSADKQQLFLDSVLNKLDVPKLYFHDLRGQDPRYKFAVIDGKQRLHTVWSFLDSDISLSEDFVMFDSEGRAPPNPGSTYRTLSPDWQELFKSRSLDVVLVQNADEEDIEEIFSRLNNGEPLSAAEKRNAMGGELCKMIRSVASHKFFTERVGFANKRYQHYEAAAKLLLIEKTEMDGGDPFCDLKKRFLDRLVRENKDLAASACTGLQHRTMEQLNSVARIFGKQDPLLRKQAYVPVYYLFIRDIEDKYAQKQLYGSIKRFLERFTVLRAENMEKPEDDRDPVLIEFDRLMQQGTNDKGSLRSRVAILRRFFLQENPDVEIRDPRRAFTDEERGVIFILSGRRCANCSREFKDISEMHADHERQWAHGGKTLLSNARGLCESCNLEAAERAE